MTNLQCLRRGQGPPGPRPQRCPAHSPPTQAQPINFTLIQAGYLRALSPAEQHPLNSHHAHLIRSRFLGHFRRKPTLPDAPPGLNLARLAALRLDPTESFGSHH